MERYSTVILRIALFIAGAIVLAFCAATAFLALKTYPSSGYITLADVLFAGTCLAAIPFYIAMYQSFKLLRLIDADCAFSESSVKALKIIARSAFLEFIICSLGGLPFFYVLAQKDDAPGFILIGLGIAGVAFIICVFASVLNQLLQKAIAIKTENDLTI